MLMNGQHEKPILFLDFDGTITARDAVDAILESYADARWLDIEQQWRAGRTGSRDCLRAQMALVKAAPAEIDELLDAIEVDEGFALLLDTCAARGLATHIISDGFDYCIRRILSRPELNLRERLGAVRIFASHLEPHGAQHWRTDFPHARTACTHGCATCKPSVMTLLNRTGAPAIFVGDGLSDRYAAGAADLVFAKGRLARYCREEGIAHVLYEGLGEVAAHLDELLRAGGLDRDFAAARADV